MQAITKAAIAAPLSFEDYDYEVVVCSNGLRVLLVSSPKVDRAAFGIGVGVGSMTDFQFKYEGLAHFCEHMLFMGTARFPNESEYQQFVQQNGGMTNAFTADMETVYYATVKPDALDGLIDRTTEFFISPSFNASAVDREVEAVNSEHEKNLQDDSRRKYHLQKHLANPNNAFSSFATGSNATLRKLDQFKDQPEHSLHALRDQLLSFHAKHYSANNMACVVVGQQPLSELRQMTIPRVEKIEDKHTVVRSGRALNEPEPCFRRTEDLGWLVDVMPVKEGDRKLDIRFIIPDQRDYYRSKPAKFISHVLGHEGRGSLLSVLKARGIASALFAGAFSENNGESLFIVSIDIVDDEHFTEESIKYVVRLLAATLTDILSMPEALLDELVVDEAKVDYIRWKYRPMFAVDELVTDSVRSLLAYKPNEVFSAAVINLDNDVNEVRRHVQLMLESLRKSEILIWRTAMKFETNDIEPVYGTKYAKQRIPSEWSEAWSNDTPDAALPWLGEQGYRRIEKNKYLPEKLEMKGGEMISDVLASPEPVSIGLPGISIWHKLENSFKLPQFVFAGRIVLPLLRSTVKDQRWQAENDVTRAKMKKQYNECNTLIELSRPARIALVYAYQRSVMESVNEDLYDARLAGVMYGLSVFDGQGRGPVGLDFTVGGFDDKGPEVMNTFIESSTSFAASDAHISTALTQLVTKFTNKTITTDPYIHVLEKSAQCTGLDNWDNKDVLEALRALSPELVRKFVAPSGTLSKDLFKGATVVGCIVGNILKDEVEKVYGNAALWKRLVPDSVAMNLSQINDRISYSEVNLAKLERVITATTEGFQANIVCHKCQSLNPSNPNGAVVLTMQGPDDDLKTVAFSNVLSIWLGDKFFDDLRTKQTLGYVVAMPLREYGHKLTRCYLAQSTKSTEFVLSRMLNFIADMTLSGSEECKVAPKELTQEEFETCCAAVMAQLAEKPKEIGTLHDRFITEIITGRNDFQRRQKQLEFLKTYTKDQFLATLAKSLSGTWIACLLYPETSETFDLQSDELSAFPWANFYVARSDKDLITTRSA